MVCVLSPTAMLGWLLRFGCACAGRDGEGSRKVRISTNVCDSTRLETRTKEFSTTASRRVWKPRGGVKAKKD